MEKLSDDLAVIRDKKYNDWARYRPAYISLVVPCIYSLTYCNHYGGGLSDIKYVITTLLGMSSILGSVFFLYVFLIRDVSKIFPEKILFARTLKPSTKILLSGDRTFSEETKKDIREKIYNRYMINLNAIADKSGKDNNYTELIDDAVGRMRSDTRFDNILFEYNCIYGFYRNLSAGVFLNVLKLAIAFVLSRFVAMPYASTFVPVAIALLLLDIVLVYFVYTNGVTYAKQMYNIFRGLDER